VWMTPNPALEAAVASLDKELERASDRAVGVLAGSIVEAHLTSAIRAKVHDPEGKIWPQRAHPSGPFGPFAVKIDFAYLLGLISDEARADLIVLKDIRNRFAHDLEVAGFDDQSIAAKCQNLTLIDQHIADWEPGVLERIQVAYAAGQFAEMEALIGRLDRFIIPGSAEEMKTPRGRFIWAARLFSFKLGACGLGYDATNSVDGRAI
jgi:hypothetical protein